jgi:hypothetical protein
MALEQQIVERVAREFEDEERSAALELLASYAGPEATRVLAAILTLSKGSLANIRRYVENARIDYRDILYWVEYYDSDPMLRGRDPRALVDEILARWGQESRH